MTLRLLEFLATLFARYLVRLWDERSLREKG
jgi:hypothetical protein